MTTYAIIGGLVVVAIFLVWLAFRQARKRGEAEADGRSNKRSAEHAREAAEIDEDVARMSDADRRRERLRYTRSK